MGGNDFRVGRAGSGGRKAFASLQLKAAVQATWPYVGVLGDALNVAMEPSELS